MSYLLREWISNFLIVEGRFEDVLRKFPHDEGVVRELAEKDPSGNLKYLDWMTQQTLDYINVIHPMNVDEAINYIVNLVTKFHNVQNRLPSEQRDINKYAGFERLQKVLESLPMSSSERRRIEKEGTEKVYSDGQIDIIYVKTKAASCLYGKGTKWCIAASEYENAFDDFKKEGSDFYFVINKTLNASDPFYKVAIDVGTNPSQAHGATFDALDDEFPISEYLSTLPKNVASTIVRAIAEHKGAPLLSIFPPSVLLAVIDNFRDALQMARDSGQVERFLNNKKLLFDEYAQLEIAKSAKVNEIQFFLHEFVRVDKEGEPAYDLQRTIQKINPRAGKIMLTQLASELKGQRLVERIMNIMQSISYLMMTSGISGDQAFDVVFDTLNNTEISPGPKVLHAQLRRMFRQMIKFGLNDDNLLKLLKLRIEQDDIGTQLAFEVLDNLSYIDILPDIVDNLHDKGLYEFLYWLSSEIEVMTIYQSTSRFLDNRTPKLSPVLIAKLEDIKQAIEPLVNDPDEANSLNAKSIIKDIEDIFSTSHGHK